MQVFCDFDGTISVEDSTDHVLSQLADPQWHDVEAAWEAGLIGSAECMQRQIALINASPDLLDDVLDEIAIDPYFVSFLQFCQSRQFPVAIISDGVDYFIRRILGRHHLTGLPIFANHLQIRRSGDKTSFVLQSPLRDSRCHSQSGVCKCKIVNTGQGGLFIGDGRSDFCASRQAQLVFAKGKLADFCADHYIPFIPYMNFADITAQMPSLLPESRNLTAPEPAFAAA